MNSHDNTITRLQAVLDILTAQGESAAPLDGRAVIAEAIARVPLTERESELLAGGVPRGHKRLTTATSKLVKAGWLVKGRGGWKATAEGERAVTALADGASFEDALASGKLVLSTREQVTAVASVVAPVVSAEVAQPGPSGVAIAGDFGQTLGAPENWAPHADEVQMAYSPVSQTWELTADLPAGSYSYKVCIDRSWGENYGAFGVRDGANHELHHPGGLVTFRYDHESHDVAATVLEEAMA